MSKAPRQTVTYEKYAPVCRGVFSLFFICLATLGVLVSKNCGNAPLLSIHVRLCTLGLLPEGRFLVLHLFESLSRLKPCLSRSSSQYCGVLHSAQLLHDFAGAGGLVDYPVTAAVAAYGQPDAGVFKFGRGRLLRRRGYAVTDERRLFVVV